MFQGTLNRSKSASQSHLFHGLDCVRGASAIVVCMAHSFYAIITPHVGQNNLMNRLLNCGAYYSVLVFFVLSGFMITMSILHNTQNNNGYFSYRSYLASRIARIYPPLLFALVLQAIVYGVIHYFDMKGATSFRMPGDMFALRERVDTNVYQWICPLFQLQHVFCNVLMLMNGSLWSLPYEFWIYILAGFWAVWAFSRSYRSGLIPFSILLLFIGAVNGRFVMYLGIWLIGAFWAVTRHYDLHVKQVFRMSVVGFAILCLAVMSAVRINIGAWAALQGDGPGRLFFGAVACMFITCVSYLTHDYWQRGLRAAPLVVAWFARSADFSYTLYLVHFPIVLLAMSIFRPLFQGWGLHVQIALWLGVVTFCILFAWLTAPILEDRSWSLPWVKSMLRDKSTPYRTVTSV